MSHFTYKLNIFSNFSYKFNIKYMSHFSGGAKNNFVGGPIYLICKFIYFL